MNKAPLICSIFIIVIAGCTNADGSKKPLVVVLSFDYETLNLPKDGENLPAILDMLDRRNIISTFFILGVTAERYPENVKRIYEKGHSLGLHTYSHNFPIFNEEDAVLIGRIYNMSTEREWSRSFKTSEVFQADLESNQKVVQRALGADLEMEMFRAPSLVVNWTKRKVYYETLKGAGIKVDSSIYQDFSDAKPYYVENGVVEVPLVTFESRLNDISKTMILVEKSSNQKVPFHLVVHPNKLTDDKIKELDEFLNSLEKTYQVTYLRVEEVPEYYETK